METETTPETLPEAIERLGLSVRSEFVPFSASRNAKAKAKPSERSLNWRVTLERQGRAICGPTDYSAGIAHCPAYKLSVADAGARTSLMRGELIEFETEKGRTANPHRSRIFPGGAAILPQSADVIYSLARDSDVLDFARFEDWASEFGYDPDSRSAEATYRACLEIALSLRAGLGEADLAALRAAAAEY